VLVGEFFTFKTGIPGGPGWISRQLGLGAKVRNDKKIQWWASSWTNPLSSRPHWGSFLLIRPHKVS